MNSKKSCVCVSCDDRVTAKERRPVVGKCVRLFFATRLFPTYLPSDGYICNKCRLMYSKWKLLPEFRDALTTMDDCHQSKNTAIADNADEPEINEECMDDENDYDQPIDDTSSEEQMEDEEICSKEESEEEIVDEEMNSDESNEAVSLIRYPLYFLSSFSDTNVFDDLSRDCK